MNKKKLKKKLKKERRQAKTAVRYLQQSIDRLECEKAECIRTGRELFTKLSEEKKQTKLWIQRCKQLKNDMEKMKRSGESDWCPGGPA